MGRKKNTETEIITPVEEIENVEEQDVIGQAWADLCIPPDVIEQAEQVDIDLSYQSFKRLLREKMQCEHRLVEINEELLLYRDTCNSILIDLKSGGMEA